MTTIQTPRTMTMTLDSRPEHVSLVGLAVRGICQHLAMDPSGCNEVELSVVEALNNVIERAYGSEPGHRIDVVLLLYENCLAFQIQDTGWSGQTNLSSSFTPALLTDDSLPERGMGLFIIRSLMDLVRYESTEKGNRLTLVKYFLGPGSPPGQS